MKNFELDNEKLDKNKLKNFEKQPKKILELPDNDLKQINKMKTQIWIILFFIIQGYQALKIEELTETNSVTFKPTQTYCIIHGYKYLRARIRYGQMFRYIPDHINKIEEKVGLF